MSIKISGTVSNATKVSGSASSVSYVTNQTYNPESTNPQSGKAVAEGIAKESEVSRNLFANALKGNKSGSIVIADDVSPIEHTVSCKVRSKNLVPFPYESKSGTASSGITYTVYDDGKVEVAGTTTKGTNFVFAQNVKLEKGIYTMSGAENLEGISFVVYDQVKGTTLQRLRSGSESLTFTIDETIERAMFYLNTSTVGATLSGYIYPQIEKGSVATVYVPYVDVSSVEVTKCGNNLLPYPYSTTGFNGTYVTLTVNADRSVTVKGTPPSDTQIDLATELKLPAGDYCIAGNGSNVRVRILGVDGASRYSVNTFKVEKGETVRVYVVALANEEIDYTFYPMLNVGTEVLPYEDYIGETYTPDDKGTVNGVTSLSTTMTFLADTENVLIDVEYNRDINKAFADEVQLAEMKALIGDVESVT